MMKNPRIKPRRKAHQRLSPQFGEAKNSVSGKPVIRRQRHYQRGAKYAPDQKIVLFERRGQHSRSDFTRAQSRNLGDGVERQKARIEIGIFLRKDRLHS
jgi:hypothetical protein